MDPPGPSVHGKNISRQEYWIGLPFLLQGIVLTQGSNPRLLHWQADSLPLSNLGRLLFVFSIGVEYT